MSQLEPSVSCNFWKEDNLFVVLPECFEKGVKSELLETGFLRTRWLTVAGNRPGDITICVHNDTNICTLIF